jgi:hypothetical protein
VEPLQNRAVATATDCDLRRSPVLDLPRPGAARANLLRRSSREHKKNMSTALAETLANILSTRLTLLEELASGHKGPHTRVHFRTLGSEAQPVQFAVLSPSGFRRELEPELAARGYCGVAIREPSDLELAELEDFHLVPEWIRWVMGRPASVEHWIESLPGSDLRGQIRRKLRASTGVRVQTAPLTVRDYEAWHTQLYVPEILSKSGAIPSWPPVAGLAEKLNLPLLSPADSTVVGDVHVRCR